MTTLTTNCTYEEVEHPSDEEVGLRLQADSAAQLFSCAAQAMFRLIHSGPVPVTDSSTRCNVSVAADDQETLLVKWLGELLYLYETTGLIFHSCQISNWEPTFVEGTVDGDKPEKPPAKYLKAVTSHQLEVLHTPDHWQARIFFEK